MSHLAPPPPPPESTVRLITVVLLLLPLQATTAVFGSYLSSVYYQLTLYRRCGLAGLPNHMMGEVRGTQKEDDNGPLSIQSSLLKTAITILRKVCIVQEV